MLQEFKKFIARGNVMDMAVGIIMGAAFTAIVKSMVDDLIMPIIGLVTGGIDFTDKFINLGNGAHTTLAAAKEAGAPVFAYGAFLNAVLTFFIVAFVVFLLIKGVNKLKEQAEDPKQKDAPPPPKDIVLLTEIRDALKAQTKPAATKKAPAKRKTATRKKTTKK